MAEFTDSPCPSDGGCPLTLSPVASRELKGVPYPFYEHRQFQSRQQRQRRRQKQYHWWLEEIRLRGRKRNERLVQAGFSREAIRQGAQAAFLSRLQRERCNSQMSFDGVHSLLGKTTRGGHHQEEAPPPRKNIMMSAPRQRSLTSRST
jgi:hypothetical protein